MSRRMVASISFRFYRKLYLGSKDERVDPINFGFGTINIEFVPSDLKSSIIIRMYEYYGIK